MRRRRLPLGHAVALGAIQGPAELLPVSSSGHLVLVPALLGWPYARLPADTRKAFEVALHAGTAVALAVLWRRDLAGSLRRPGETALLAGPAAAAGLALERVVEERLSAPRTTAIAQIAAGAALALSERGLHPPAIRTDRGQAPLPRDRGQAPLLRDSGGRALARIGAVGLAQALALVPGVSRNGAVLTAAALAGYGRPEAAALSRRGALPVVGGAAALKAYRLARHGLQPAVRVPFAAGAATAFASAVAAAPLARLPERHSWLPWAAWRVGLGALALRRLQALQ